MPNTPALVRQGMTALSGGSHAKPEHLERAEKLFAAVGQTIVLDERHMDAVTGLSASGPAFIYIVIESLADGGVKVGLPRDVSLRLAAQTVLGSGAMVRETGQHPAVLKDAVTTPSGTTIGSIPRAGGRAGASGAAQGRRPPRVARPSARTSVGDHAAAWRIPRSSAGRERSRSSSPRSRRGCWRATGLGRPDGVDDEPARAEWQAATLHALIRGVVAEDDRSEAKADLVDALHELVIDSLAAGRERPAPRAAGDALTSTTGSRARPGARAPRACRQRSRPHAASISAARGQRVRRERGVAAGGARRGSFSRVG
jgi:hypothetical protein